MQLYALNSKDKLIAAVHASKREDYRCLECEGVVRVRGGMHRRAHFYHLRVSEDCRQSGKTLTHLRVQCYCQNALPAGEGRLEVRFPKISRVADVVWEKEKLIFEVQCSSITAEEAAARNRDYASVGYRVVWILHDKRFGKKAQTSVERFLERSCHYYTNIKAEDDGEDVGVVYDRYVQYEKGLRKVSLAPVAIDLSQPQVMDGTKLSPSTPVSYRVGCWSHCFAGDLVCCNLGSYFDKMETSPQELDSVVRRSADKLKQAYRVAFRMILELLC